MSLIDLVNEMEEKMFIISKNIEKELNTVIIKGEINKKTTMKEIEINDEQKSELLNKTKELAEINKNSSVIKL